MEVKVYVEDTWELPTAAQFLYDSPAADAKELEDNDVRRFKANAVLYLYKAEGEEGEEEKEAKEDESAKVLKSGLRWTRARR